MEKESPVMQGVFRLTLGQVAALIYVHIWSEGHIHIHTANITTKTALGPDSKTSDHQLRRATEQQRKVISHASIACLWMMAQMW